MSTPISKCMVGLYFMSAFIFLCVDIKVWLLWTLSAVVIYEAANVVAFEVRRLREATERRVVAVGGAQD